jgi:hypothetical protein
VTEPVLAETLSVTLVIARVLFSVTVPDTTIEAPKVSAPVIFVVPPTWSALATATPPDTTKAPVEVDPASVALLMLTIPEKVLFPVTLTVEAKVDPIVTFNEPPIVSVLDTETPPVTRRAPVLNEVLSNVELMLT